MRRLPAENWRGKFPWRCRDRCDQAAPRVGDGVGEAAIGRGHDAEHRARPGRRRCARCGVPRRRSDERVLHRGQQVFLGHRARRTRQQGTISAARVIRRSRASGGLRFRQARTRRRLFLREHVFSLRQSCWADGASSSFWTSVSGTARATQTASEARRRPPGPGKRGHAAEGIDFPSGSNVVAQPATDCIGCISSAWLSSAACSIACAFWLTGLTLHVAALRCSVCGDIPGSPP